MDRQPDPGPCRAAGPVGLVMAWYKNLNTHNALPRTGPLRPQGKRTSPDEQRRSAKARLLDDFKAAQARRRQEAAREHQ